MSFQATRDQPAEKPTWRSLLHPLGLTPSRHLVQSTNPIRDRCDRAHSLSCRSQTHRSSTCAKQKISNSNVRCEWIITSVSRKGSRETRTDQQGERSKNESQLIPAGITAIISALKGRADATANESRSARTDRVKCAKHTKNVANSQDFESSRVNDPHTFHSREDAAHRHGTWTNERARCGEQ